MNKIIIVSTMISIACLNVLGQSTRIDWHSFDTGFAAPASGGNMVPSVVGQSFIGYSQSSNTSIQSGFLVGFYPGEPTSVEEISNEVPVSYELHQNYPNPFNPSTTIRFAIPEGGFVSLKIYDLLGREVSTLIDDELSAGVYDVTWEAAGYSSGVYIYKLTTGVNQKMKRLILLK